MSTFPVIAQRSRALLIQAMERRWPGCGAHTKRHQVSGRDELVWSGLLAPDVQRDMRAFSAGWDEGVATAVRIMQDAAPFQDGDWPASAGRPNHQQTTGKPRGSRATPAAQAVARRDDRAVAALASLQSLFSGTGGVET